VTAGPDQHRCADSLIEDPTPVVATNARDGRAEQEPRSRSSQQIVIELATANPEAHGTVVGRLDHTTTADQPHTKSRDGLESSSLPILVRIDPNVVEDLRRNPPRAHFVARKHRLVDDHDIET
jgi:hypothetical protein